MILLIIQLTGADAVIARFEKRRGGLAFLQGVRRPLPDPLLAGELLQGFPPVEAGQKIILSVPPALMHARELAIPVTDRRKLRELLPLELAGEMAASAEEMVFDAVPMSDGRVMAAWCRRREIATLIETFARQGLEPEIVTGAVLHWNLLLPAGVTGCAAVTDGSALMIGTSQEARLVRALPEDNIDLELARTVAAFELSRNIVVPARLSIGGADQQPDDLPLQADLLETFGGDRAAARDLAGAYAVAGACLAGSCINFRTGDLAYTAGQLKNRRRLRLTAILAAVLVALLFGEVALRYWLARKDVASLDSSVARIYSEIFPSRKVSRDPVGEIRSEIRKVAGAASGQRILPGMKLLAELKGEDVTGFFEMELEGRQVRLKGDARSTRAVNDFRTRAAAAMETAEVAEIKSRSDGTVSFVFRGTFKESNR